MMAPWGQGHGSPRQQEGHDFPYSASPAQNVPLPNTLHLGNWQNSPRAFAAQLPSRDGSNCLCLESPCKSNHCQTPAGTSACSASLMGTEWHSACQHSTESPASQPASCSPIPQLTSFSPGHCAQGRAPSSPPAPRAAAGWLSSCSLTPQAAQHFINLG